jgi:hypothetical protein
LNGGWWWWWWWIRRRDLKRKGEKEKRKQKVEGVVNESVEAKNCYKNNECCLGGERVTRREGVDLEMRCDVCRCMYEGGSTEERRGRKQSGTGAPRRVKYTVEEERAGLRGQAGGPWGWTGQETPASDGDC